MTRFGWKTHGAQLQLTSASGFAEYAEPSTKSVRFSACRGVIGEISSVLIDPLSIGNDAMDRVSSGDGVCTHVVSLPQTTIYCRSRGDR